MLEISARLRRGAFVLNAEVSVPTPGVTALFGRSGCGKTTLVNMIAGLIDDGTGRVVLDGGTWLDSARGVRIAAERRGIGYVFQDARLFPHYTVHGNLLYGARRRPLPAGRFDEVVTLLGLATLLQRRPAGLSGGERQRVALGRALLSSPRLLLLDEPLAGLDDARREEVLPFLERLRDHFAVPMIFVSHRFDEVLRLATHLIVMDQGTVTASGDVGSVSLSPALRSIVGADAVGAVLDGRVAGVDAATDLATVAVGSGSQIKVPSRGLSPGQSVRLQLLARDLILAREEPRGISVRNHLRGTVHAVSADGDADLIEVDIGGARLLSRITAAATRELQLATSVPVWVLVKAVSVSPHVLGTAGHGPG